MKKQFYFTFGFDHTTKSGMRLDKNYTRILANNMMDARNLISAVRGNKWSFPYEETEFISHINQFNLTLIPMIDFIESLDDVESLDDIVNGVLSRTTMVADLESSTTIFVDLTELDAYKLAFAFKHSLFKIKKQVNDKFMVIVNTERRVIENFLM